MLYIYLASINLKEEEKMAIFNVVTFVAKAEKQDEVTQLMKELRMILNLQMNFMMKQ